MSNTYTLGTIGCGGISNYHSQAYANLDQIEIVAACDVRPDRVERYAAQYGVERTYTDFRELLHKEELDLVLICTWQGTHGPITVAAAQRPGVKGILCEKPMAASLAEADAMIAAANENNVKLAIGHQRRFMGSRTKAKELIAEGALGKPTLVRRNGGGGMLNTNTHNIDAVRYYLGDPATQWVIAQVERRTDRYERGEQCEDLCLLEACFEGGARMVIESDMPGSDQPENTYLYGTDGILDVQNSKVRLLSSKRADWEEFECRDPNLPVAQMEELLAWIEGGPEHRGAPRHGRAAVEILMAAYESARIRGLVRMPLETRGNPLDQMIADGCLPVEKPGKYDIRDCLWLGAPRPWAKIVGS
jgi:predicted dehydrogenase